MIAEREERGERVELRFVSVAVPEIVEAGLSGNSAQITLRFVSRIVTTTQTTTGKTIRSEEHTSELQSLMRISYAVFCLKKKKQNNYIHTGHTITKSKIQQR